MKKRNRFLLIPLTKMQKKWFFASIIMGFLYSAMLVATPFLVSFILNSAEEGTMLGFHYNMGVMIAFLLLFSIVTMLFFMLHKRAVNHFLFSVKLTMEEKSIRHILNFENSPSKASNIINHDIPGFCNLYYRNIFKIIASASFIAAGLLYSAIISFYAFLIEVFFLIAAILIHAAFKKRLTRNYDRFRDEKQSAIKTISSFINGKLTIQSNGAFSYADAAVGVQIKKKAEAEYSYYLCKRISNLLIATVPMAATLFSGILFVAMISSGAVGKNEALAAAYVVGYIIWELIKLVPLLNDIASVKSVREYVSMVSAAEFSGESQGADRTPETPENVKIDMRDVSVQYEDKTVLHNVSIEFQPSKKYLIFGGSGSGKSTLLQALMNTVPYTGAISDGTGSGAAYRDCLSYLPQSVEVFPGTVSENIAVGGRYSKTEIETALKNANYYGLSGEEAIDPGAASFSGGELRKISFARAMFHKNEKNILLLDEPFEGLDQESRLMIEKAILEHEGMALVVSHIVDSYFLERVDQIIILESGTVIYCGDYSNIPHALKRYYLNQI